MSVIKNSIDMGGEMRRKEAGRSGRARTFDPALNVRGRGDYAPPSVVYGVLFLLWVGLVVYGSLLPWRFVVPGHLHHLAGWTDWHWWWKQLEPPRAGWLQWRRLLYSDVPMNVLVYVPVGLLGRLYVRSLMTGWRKSRGLRTCMKTAFSDEPRPLGSGFEALDGFRSLTVAARCGVFIHALRKLLHWVWGSFWQIALPIAAAGSLSMAMECTQVLEPARVSSMVDWWTNLIGAAAGAVIGVPLVMMMGYGGTFVVKRMRRMGWGWGCAEKPDDFPRQAGGYVGEGKRVVGWREAVAGLMQMAVAAAVVYSAVRIGPGGPGDDARVMWMPLLSLFGFAYNVVIGMVSWQLGCWLVVAAAMAAAWMIRDGRIGWWRMAGGVVLLACVRQGLRYAMGHTVDTTDLMMALAAVVVLWVGVWSMRTPNEPRP